MLSDLPDREHVVHTHASVTRRQQVFGYTEEELRPFLAGEVPPAVDLGPDGLCRRRTAWFDGYRHTASGAQ